MPAHPLNARMANAMRHRYLWTVALSFAALSLGSAVSMRRALFGIGAGAPSEKEQGIDVLHHSDGIRRATELGSPGSVRENRSANSMFNPTLIVIEAFIRELRTM